MATTETPDSIVLRCNLGWEDVREVMATPRILTLMRRAWTVAGFMFAALLAESVALLRTVVTRPAVYGSGRGSLPDELIAVVCLCALLVCWSARRVGRLPAVVRADWSPRNQAAVPPARPGRPSRARVRPERKLRR
jgi:hypothetical protein